MEERKASDILLSIENQIREILGYVRNLDLSHKLILDRFNRMVPTTVVSPESVMEFPPADNLSFPEEEPMETITEQVGKRRNARPIVHHVPVQQKIIYPDGKNVYMAKVEIYDSANKLIKQTRTNQVGKWVVPLEPGPYTILVNKAGSQLKPKVELKYQISVPDQTATLELEPQTI